MDAEVLERVGRRLIACGVMMRKKRVNEGHDEPGSTWSW
jgi:hypothetical protein